MVHHQPKQLNTPPSGHTKQDLACMRVSGQEDTKYSKLCGLQLPTRWGMLQSQLQQPENQGQSQRKYSHGGQSNGSPGTKLMGISCLFPLFSFATEAKKLHRNQHLSTCHNPSKSHCPMEEMELIQYTEVTLESSEPMCPLTISHVAFSMSQIPPCALW